MRKGLGTLLMIVIGIVLISVIIITGRQRHAHLLAQQSAANASLVKRNAAKAAASSAADPTTQLAKIGHGKTVKYAALGDSLAAGYETSTRENSYQYLVQAYLKHTLGFAKVDLSGFWREGTTARIGGLANVGKVIAAKPDIVTVEYGTNDQDLTNPNYVYSDVFRTNMATLVNRLKKGLPHAKIVLVTSWNSPTAAEYDRQIKSVAKAAHVQIADISQVWRKDRNTISRKSQKSWRGHGDGFHPNDRGNQAIAKLIEAQLTAAYQRTTR